MEFGHGSRSLLAQSSRRCGVGRESDRGAAGRWLDLEHIGAARYRNGQWKEAIAAFEKSMELRDGGDSFDWFFLAMCHWQLGDKQAARKWYDQAVVWMDKNEPEERATPPLPGRGGGTAEDH